MKQQEILVVEATEDPDFEHVFDIRHDVFQEEHYIPEETEIDGNDHIARHYLAVLDGEYVGTIRWRMTLGGNVRIERVAVLKDFRGRGVGLALMKHIMKDLPSGRDTYLHALVEVAPFYEKLGFRQRGEEFEEAGLRHVEMFLP